MTAPDSSSDSRRKRPWSDTEISIVILRELYQRKKNLDNTGISVHTLSSIEGIPTQRDQRVKEILEFLCEKGWVERVRIEDRTGYRMTEDGVRYWVNHGLAFLGLVGVRRRAQA